MRASRRGKSSLITTRKGSCSLAYGKKRFKMKEEDVIWASFSPKAFPHSSFWPLHLPQLDTQNWPRSHPACSGRHRRHMDTACWASPVPPKAGRTLSCCELPGRAGLFFHHFWRRAFTQQLCLFTGLAMSTRPAGLIQHCFSFGMSPSRLHNILVYVAQL